VGGWVGWIGIYSFPARKNKGKEILKWRSVGREAAGWMSAPLTSLLFLLLFSRSRVRNHIVNCDSSCSTNLDILGKK
jgi:hypothetical protein